MICENEDWSIFSNGANGTKTGIVVSESTIDYRSQKTKKCGPGAAFLSCRSFIQQVYKEVGVTEIQDG